MNGIRRGKVVDSIVSTIRDYRFGEVTIDNDHVERWVRQFEVEDQPVILQELDRLLKQYYVPRPSMVDFLTDMVRDEEIVGANPIEGLDRVEFLDIQNRGNSQQDLLSMVEDILGAEYGVALSECGTYPSTFVYLDDCLFTGNRAKWDILRWAKNAPRGSRLFLCFYAVHMQSTDYLKRGIEPTLRERGIKIYYRARRRLLCDTSAVEAFWPRSVPDDQYVRDCVENTVSRADQKGWSVRLERPPGMPAVETVFSSPAARDVIEMAFLRKGAYIMSLPDTAKEEMRPMGFEKLESLGFGSLFITYRNIANNCPLVLWWGLPELGSHHPLGQWYPLFLRRGNETII